MSAKADSKSVACSSCHKLHNNTTSPSKSLSEVHNGESPFSVHSTHRPAHLMPWTADRPKPLNLDDTSHAQGMKPLAPQHVVGDDACPSDTSKTLLLDPVLGGDPHPHPHCLSHLAHDDVPECLRACPHPEWCPAGAHSGVSEDTPMPSEGEFSVSFVFP